jgi:CO/xanthine dehydrogenase FAD-binding subunit
MGPDAFGPPGGGFAAGAGAAVGGAVPPGGSARPADGHAVPVRAAGGSEFGGAAERAGYELGTFELPDDGDAVFWTPDQGDAEDFDLASSGQFAAVTRSGGLGPAAGGFGRDAAASDGFAPGGAGSTGAVWAGTGSVGAFNAAAGDGFAPSGSGPAGAGWVGTTAAVGESDPAASGESDSPSWFGAGVSGAPGTSGASGTAGVSSTPDLPGRLPAGDFAPAYTSAAVVGQSAPDPAIGAESFPTGLAGSMVSAAPVLFGPQSVVEAVQILAARPDAVIIAGGTVVMPDITSGRRHPAAILTLHRCAELRGWSPGPGEVLLHAGLTLTEMQRQELRAQVPAVAQAARTVGAPHIRAAATLGGNLMVGPASADLPVVLAALGAEVLVASVGGVRTVSVFEFYDRDGVPQLSPGELIVGARVPVVRGMQGFMKIGVRGGTSRAILSTTLAVDPARRSATCVVGAMAQAALPDGSGRAGLPTLLRADHADRWLADQVDWDAGAIADPAVYETFGRLVAESLVYGDGAGTLGGGGDPYRRKAAEICARRLLLRALPPLGWLDQVRDLQRRADFQRAKQRVERAEQAKSQDR